MLLVNKKISKYFLICIVLVFTACTSNKNITIEKNTSKREYKDISKDAIFEAAKKAFVFSGNAVFFIDSYRNNLYVTRTKMNHYPFYAVTFEDRWNLVVDEENNTSYAKLDVKRVHDYDEKDVRFFDKDLHNLLWSRIDYFLGLNDEWLSCDFNHKFRTFDGALCDNVDLKVIREPNKHDVIKNILISQRKDGQTIIKNDDDVLSEDIVLTIDENKPDILKKEDKIEDTLEEDATLDKLDEEILKLDQQVSDNIDETLDKIEDNTEN